MLILRGTVVDCASRTVLRVLERAIIGIDESGHILFREEEHEEALEPGGVVKLRSGAEVAVHPDCIIKKLPPRGFVCPGLVDTHTHAPQFSFAGLGYDMQLLDWLETYTFPAETKFKDAAFASRVCHAAVSRTLRHGTTSCVWFSTIHTDAAVQLGRIAAHLGQRSFVGKVNMDRNSPATYCETTSESLAETERFVTTMLADQASGAGGQVVDPTSNECVECAPRGPVAQPVITPRFVPTCSAELMRGLAELAARHNLLIQSHISENLGEIDWVKSLHPTETSYTAVYDAAGLLGARTILAHGVYLGKEERALFRARGAHVSHCPMSNCMLRSGMLNVRRMLSEGVSVSLGTDVSGGASPSMLSAIREAQKVSNLVSLVEYEHHGQTWPPLTQVEAFWLATAGKSCLCLCGRFCSLCLRRRPRLCLRLRLHLCSRICASKPRPVGPPQPLCAPRLSHTRMPSRAISCYLASPLAYPRAISRVFCPPPRHSWQAVRPALACLA